MVDLRETLPAMQRLALVYAPGRMREPTLALLALDSRLAGVLRSASEPMLAQIRLAWWRDMLARDAAERPGGEPVLALLSGWRDEAASLVALVDGWEQLVEPDSLGAEAMRAFCAGRGEACAALARVAGCSAAEGNARTAGEGWALADLAARLTDPQERETAAGLVREADWRRIALPRALRPLAILHGLAANAARSGQDFREPGPGSLLLAMRIGLCGR
jgi:phytoene synthase